MAGSRVLIRWRHGLALLCGLLAALPGGPSRAQDALILHIRLHRDPGLLGPGGGGEAARLAREAAWERGNIRAHHIIESVCTGCLAPWHSEPARVQPVSASLSSPRGEPAASPEISTAGGVEPDPFSGASDATSDTTIRERRP